MPRHCIWPSVCRSNPRYQLIINIPMHQRKMDHIDKAIDFLDNLEKLGDQLQRAASQQQLFLSRMLELSRTGDESSEEYLTLQQQSQNLQAMIDKWKPIYEERLAMVREVRRKK